MTLKQEVEFTKKLRANTTCPACGNAKDSEGILCWDCFKYREDIEPFKYSALDIKSWLKMAQEAKS